MINKLKFFLRQYSKYPGYISETLLNPQKGINTLKYFFSGGKNEKIGYVPPVFVASISTVCNLRCPTCQYVLKDRDVFEKGGFIKVENFRSIVEKYTPHIITLGLTGGEPLLHPELDKLVEIIKKNKLLSSISTNGILIKKKFDLIKSFDSISVSMDGYDYETFKKFRGGTEKQFDEILEGLSLLRQNKINFVISFMLTEGNVDKINEMIEFIYKTRPNVLEFHNINPHGSPNYRPLIRDKKTIQILNDVIGKKDYPFDILIPVIFEPNSEHFKTARCNQPWRYCYFDNEGNIAPCCHLRHSEKFGNIFRDYNFNSKKIKSFRRSIMEKSLYSSDCVWCTKRFMGEDYGLFNAKKKKWILID